MGYLGRKIKNNFLEFSRSLYGYVHPNDGFRLTSLGFDFLAIKYVESFLLLSALREKHFPVPKAVAHNKHCMVMSLVQGYPIAQVKNLEDPEVKNLEDPEVKNSEDPEVTMIDFPQMVSVDHRNAQMYFDREVECVFLFFSGSSPGILLFLDKKLAASGHTRRNQEDIAKEGEYDTDDDSEAENTYKDKGGKSCQNSKIQKQLGGL
ncbi:hypothetical protein M0R45_016699 [Rubus argutus]|uniref:non-specific serine/threonine protein kinase n=1 Tax=Rubus argutus TaxID=59490 RepID=A0AAW1XWV9_RUBAR